jgi:fused signal recognition particle receptor
MGLFDKLFKRNKVQEEAKETLDKGLEKTKESFFSKITKAVAGKSVVDAAVLRRFRGSSDHVRRRCGHYRRNH